MKKWIHKYRFVVFEGGTSKERFSFRLSRLKIFVFSGISVIFVLFLAFLIIGYTPLREYIPGYSSAKLKKQVVMLMYKADSLEQVIDRNDRYYSSIQDILLGDTLQEDSKGIIDPEPRLLRAPKSEEALSTMDDINLYPSKMDSILRREVENNERYNVFNPFLDRSAVDLYPPVKGNISQHFNVERHHYGVDISLEENSPVKAVAEGVVVFAEWTVETGFVIIVKHDFDLLSVYKHNLALLKKQGEFVKKGEVIALTGNTGEYTTGPHLHFELWEDGHALDPEEFFDFD